MKNIFIEDYNKSKSDEINISPSHIFQKATKSTPKEIYYYELNSNEKNNSISKISANHIYIIKLNDSIFSNLYNLSSLNLSHNIISEFPKKITNLKNLKYLNLNNNLLSQLPSYLKDLPELEELYLSHNSISNISSSIQNIKNLKILDLSYNKITYLPIEIGFIKELIELDIFNNYFTEIPSSICYLKNLKNIKLEWFEFLDPPQTSDMLDGDFILSLKNILKSLINQSKPYCDYSTFILQLSQNIQNKIKDNSFNSFETEKTECFKYNSNDIFYALENEYLGVIKSLVESDDTNLKIKNQTGKTILYIAIQQGKKDIYDYLLSKINFRNISNPNIYIHKAIRIRNYNLLVKLYLMGADFNSIDEKANNCYHVLFSVFYKNFIQCAQIGNFLIKNNVKGINDLNLEHWGPIHIASKYSSLECLKWIFSVNKELIKNNKEIFNVNLKGKNDWTPLHLSLHSYKYNESILLIKMGSSLFDRTEDGKRMKNITNNFFLTKMLNQKIEKFYNKKYGDNNNENNNNQNINKNINNNNIIENNDNSFIRNYKNLAFESTRNEILLNSEYSLMERYHSLMLLNLNNNPNEIESIVMEIFQQIKIINSKFSIIFVEICQIIEKFQFTSFLNFLIQIQKNNNSIQENSFVSKQLNNTINYLKKINEDKFMTYNLYKSKVNTENLLGNTIQLYDLNNSMVSIMKKNEESILQNEDFFYEMNKSINNEQRINYYNGNNDNQGNFFKLEQKTISDNSENGEEIQTIEQENEIGS
jgi:hypothetical protein